jgi:hypothetical protein
MKTLSLADATLPMGSAHGMRRNGPRSLEMMTYNSPKQRALRARDQRVPVAMICELAVCQPPPNDLYKAMSASVESRSL